MQSHTLNGGTQKRTLGTAAEMRDALTDLFKLRLDQLDGLDPALARLAAATIMSRRRTTDRASPAADGNKPARAAAVTAVIAISGSKSDPKSGSIPGSPTCA